jgi:hypothetical protein
MVPELLPGVHVRDVDFHSGHLHRRDGVPNGHRRVGVGAGVEHDADCLAPRSVDRVHEGAFMVGLETLHVEAVSRAGVLGELFDVGER